MVGQLCDPSSLKILSTDLGVKTPRQRALPLSSCCILDLLLHLSISTSKMGPILTMMAGISHVRK